MNPTIWSCFLVALALVSLCYCDKVAVPFAAYVEKSFHRVSEHVATSAIFDRDHTHIIMLEAIYEDNLLILKRIDKKSGHVDERWDLLSEYVFTKVVLFEQRNNFLWIGLQLRDGNTKFYEYNMDEGLRFMGSSTLSGLFTSCASGDMIFVLSEENLYSFNFRSFALHMVKNISFPYNLAHISHIAVDQNQSHIYVASKDSELEKYRVSKYVISDWYREFTLDIDGIVHGITLNNNGSLLFVDTTHKYEDKIYKVETPSFKYWKSSPIDSRLQTRNMVLDSQEEHLYLSTPVEENKKMWRLNTLTWEKEESFDLNYFGGFVLIDNEKQLYFISDSIYTMKLGCGRGKEASEIHKNVCYICKRGTFNSVPGGKCLACPFFMTSEEGSDECSFDYEMMIIFVSSIAGTICILAVVLGVCVVGCLIAAAKYRAIQKDKKYKRFEEDMLESIPSESL